jgi:RNA polymerase sigma factor (sigma-70 family)
MLRLWRRRATFAPHGSVRGYLSAATYNAARDAIKADARLRGREAMAATQHGLVSPYAMPDAAVSDVADISVRVNQAVLSLPGRTGEVFRLWWSGLSYAEVAEAAGISVKGVERARARALAQLAHALADLEPNRDS